MILVGALLAAAVALVGIEGVGYSRGGYGSAFWRLPLDAKLDHVAQHGWEWWWISIWSLVGVFAMSAGLFGLTGMVAVAGEPSLALVGLGGYVVALIAWVWGQTVQAGAVSFAAKRRVEAGSTPDWIHPLWQIGYLAEGIWIIGANLAYVAMGLALLQTSLLPAWVGWVTVGGGLVVPLAVVITRDGFPQLALLVPAVIGIAALVESL